MRRLLISAAAFALLAAPAWAQYGHHDRPADAPAAGQAPAQPGPQAAPQRPGPQAGQGHGHLQGGNRGGAPAAAPAAPAALPANGGLGQGHRGNGGNRGNAQGRPNSSPNFNNRPGNPPGFNNNRPGNPNTGNRPGFGGARHDFSNFRDFHRDFRASRRFRGPDYRRPAGWYDHRWTFGETLPAAFWARDYWLSDYQSYDLPPPPYGATWVRVGTDALLVDEDSGEVITVEYDVFY